MKIINKIFGKIIGDIKILSFSGFCFTMVQLALASQCITENQACFLIALSMILVFLLKVLELLLNVKVSS